MINNCNGDNNDNSCCPNDKCCDGRGRTGVFLDLLHRIPTEFPKDHAHLKAKQFCEYSYSWTHSPVHNDEW